MLPVSSVSLEAIVRYYIQSIHPENMFSFPTFYRAPASLYSYFPLNDSF